MTKKNPSAILLVSVLLNVFLIGIVISCYMMKPNRGALPPMRGGPEAQFERAKEFLSEDGKSIVDEVLSQQGANMRGNTHEIGGLQREAHDVLTADYFDAKRLKNIHDKMNENGEGIKEQISQTIYDIATKLSDEDRMKFFERAFPDHPRRPPPPR